MNTVPQRAHANAPLVLVTTSFPIRGDGSEAAGSFVSDLVEEMAGHRPVRVVAPGIESGLERWAEGVEVCRFAAPAKPLSTLRPWQPGDLQWLRRVLRGGQAAVDRAVAGGASDILALWGLPCGAWARRAAAKARLDYSVWLLGSDVWSLGKIPLVRGQLARVMQDARQVWADGYQLAADASRIGGVDVDFLPSTRRITLVDVPLPRNNPPYRLLFLGRWHRNKGIDLLLEALAMLDDDDWARIETVEIQGGGPLESLVRERVATLRESGRPVTAGHFLAKPEAEAAIARADWVLIPSRIESIPVVFSDAMKLGRPVVASPVGDLSRLVKTEPTCGLVADVATASAWHAALRGAIQQQPAAYSEATYDRARMFQLANIAEHLCNQ